MISVKRNFRKKKKKIHQYIFSEIEIKSQKKFKSFGNIVTNINI